MQKVEEVVNEISAHQKIKRKSIVRRKHKKEFGIEKA